MQNAEDTDTRSRRLKAPNNPSRGEGEKNASEEEKNGCGWRKKRCQLTWRDDRKIERGKRSDIRAAAQTISGSSNFRLLSPLPSYDFFFSNAATTAVASPHPPPQSSYPRKKETKIWEQKLFVRIILANTAKNTFMKYMTTVNFLLLWCAEKSGIQCRWKKRHRFRLNFPRHIAAKWRTVVVCWRVSLSFRPAFA